MAQLLRYWITITTTGKQVASTEPLNGFRSLLARLKARPDSEHEQAILRIVIVALVLIWLGLNYAPSEGEPGVRSFAVLIWQVCYLAISIAILVAICRWPGVNVPRRLIGTLGDNLTATMILFATEQAGFAMIGVFLFVAFGNGFRYGRRYLFMSAALALFGFGSALLLAPYWSTLQTAGWSLFLAMMILPLYVSTLLNRVHIAQRKAEEANLAKSAFLANMSHEMRTPLNGVVGVIDLLRATALSPQQGELMRLLSHSATLLRALVDDVLDITKIEAGRLQIEIAEFDLHATLNGLTRLLRPHARAKGLTLRAMVDPALDYRLRGDEHHLRQILLNLLSNAVKFTPAGEIQLSVALLATTKTGFHVRFEIEDTGIGIAEDVRNRIFDRFVQADESTTRRFGGTGLGTTIAKQLVELMGGTIGVESEPGKGSTFWFELTLLNTGTVAGGVVNAQAQEQSPTAVVVAALARAGEVTPRVIGAVGRATNAPGVDEAVAQLRELTRRGVSVPAVVVTGTIDEAAEVLERVAEERGDMPTALIYLTSDVAEARAEPRLRRIDGVQVLPFDSPQRHVHNAIHSSTAWDPGRTADVIDLTSALEIQRQSLRILVADDNATNLAIITRLLERAGHVVLSAPDGEQALDVYEAEGAELAILDFNMPERNGIEVTAAIRMMEPAGVRMPIIILSAAVTPEAKERSRAAGADEFVGKPYDAARLLNVIDRMARRNQRAATPVAANDRERRVAMPDRSPLLDVQRVRDVEHIATTPDFLAQLLRGFCSDVDLMLKKLDAAVATGQVEAAADALHAISGAALGIGARQLAERVAAAEVQLRAGRILQIAATMPELRQCFDATARELNTFLVTTHQVSM